MTAKDRKVARPRPAAAALQRVEASLDDIPGWVPYVVYAAVTVILFREFILGSATLLGLDTIGLSYFARNFFTQFLHAFNSYPLWNPLIYGGLPFIDGMHGDIFYPPSLLLMFMNAEQMWGWKLALHVFLAGVFAYLWLRELEVSRGSSLLGGLIFMMGADLVSLIFPGGDGKLFVSALAPLLFLLTERAVRLQRARDYAVFALGLALVMFTSHMQLAYFTVWGVTLYFLFRLVQRWRAGEIVSGRAAASLGAFAVAGILGVGAAAIQFMPPLEYLREWSHRASKAQTEASGYQYSTTWSLHPEEVMSLVVPDFVGDDVQTETRPGQSYWGRNPAKMNSEYAGFIPLLLLPLLFIRRRRGRSIFFLSLAALAVLYALGANTPLFRLFYLIPGVSLFRAPSLIIFLYGLSIATLGALAFDRAAEMGRSDAEAPAARKTLWIGVGIITLLALLASAGVFMTVWRGLFYSMIGPDKVAALATHTPAIVKSFWITVAVAVAVAASWEGYARGWWSARGALVAVCVVAFLELYRVDRPFIEGTVLMNENMDPTMFVPDESIDYLRQQQAAGEVFRVFDLGAVMNIPGRYPSNGMAIHGIEQLAGHHGNEIGRYRELLGGDQPYNLRRSWNLLDLTNTEYVVAGGLIDLPGFAEVYRGSRSIVYRKPDVLPRAYLVGAVEVVGDSVAVDRLLDPGFDFRTTALVPAPLPAVAAIEPDPQGSVQWLERSNTRHRLRVETDRPALLVVLDNYYHAWKAQVDGSDSDVVRANHTFRAVRVPAGGHDVTFTYDGGYLKGAAIISALILLALLLVAFGAPLLERRRRAAA